jgi:hypothetical protein
MKIQRSILLSIATLTFSVCLSNAQTQNNSEDKITPTPDLQSKYKIYVPKDLDDCFLELKKMLPQKTLKEMQEKSEKDMIVYHFGLGMWLRNNWGLWGGSRLSEYFNEIGLHHPDDMSGVILKTFWRHLHDKPLEVEKEIAYYKEYWAKQTPPKQNRKQVRKPT